MNLQTKPTKSRHALRFRFRGREVALERFSPRRTVLDWLREDERATGTKEGCAEGDCGACTVVLARLRRGKLTYEAFNACILLLGQLDGAELITVEDLAHGQTLHPVQQAMVDHHASQCGFCTPGIVMSLFAAYHSGAPATAASLCDQLAGNLCRCTGYRPILVAGLATCDGAPTDRFAATAAERAQALAALADDAELFVGDESQFFAAPASLDSLAAVYQRFPDATLVAGATDVGLWVTKLLRDLKRVIWLGRVDGLDAIAEIADGELSLGAGVTLAEAAPLVGDDPSGSKRTDAPLRLDPGAGRAALSAATSPTARRSAILRPRSLRSAARSSCERAPRSAGCRWRTSSSLTASRTARRGNLCWRSSRLASRTGQHYRAFKVSKRFDEDISAVMMAIRLDLDGRRIAGARIAFGGMAATPKRAANAEKALAGVSLDQPASWRAARAALSSDFAPLTDQRASAGYRMTVAANLVEKALIEISGASAPTRIGALHAAE